MIGVAHQLRLRSDKKSGRFMHAFCRAPSSSSHHRVHSDIPSSFMYGRLGALPIYTQSSCNLDDLVADTPVTPRVRGGKYGYCREWRLVRTLHAHAGSATCMHACWLHVTSIPKDHYRHGRIPGTKGEAWTTRFQLLLTYSYKEAYVLGAQQHVVFLLELRGAQQQCMQASPVKHEQGQLACCCRPAQVKEAHKEVLTQRARVKSWPQRHWRALGLTLLLVLLTWLALSSMGVSVLPRGRAAQQTSPMILLGRQGVSCACPHVLAPCSQSWLKTVLWNLLDTCCRRVTPWGINASKGQAHGIHAACLICTCCLIMCRGGVLQQLPRALRDEAAAWLAERGLALRQRGARLGICIMTADFWGLKSAGGTATAYHLLAQVLIIL